MPRLIALCVCLVTAAALPPLLWNVGGSPVDLSRTPFIQTGRVVIFSTYVGMYPEIRMEDGAWEWCNGGIPQLANKTAHAAKIKRDIAARNVSAAYDGYVVVDYESWRARWNTTNPLYHNASIRLELAENPGMSLEEATAAAVGRYNEAALDFMTLTLEAFQAVLPAARLGFYGYPTFGYWDVNLTTVHTLNDQLVPLWEASTALFPSVYEPYMSGVDEPYSMNLAYVNGTIQEAVRCAGLHDGPALPVAPYTWYRYHDGEPHGLEFLTTEDLALEMNFPRTLPGVSGAVMWGNEVTPGAASNVSDYLAANAALLESGKVQPAADLGASIQGGATAASPPFPIDGPVPPFKSCGL